MASDQISLDTQEAEARIARALADGASELSLAELRILSLPISLERLAPQLVTLDLSECAFLQDVSGLSGLTGLQALNLSGCEGLEDVSVLTRLTGLQSLDLSGCNVLKNVRDLGGLTGLQSLNLCGCELLQDVSNLTSLTSLKELDLSWCDALNDISVLGDLTSLQILNLHGCLVLTDVSILGNLTGLLMLNLSECEALKDVSELASMTGLKTLSLDWCEALKDEINLIGIKSLQSLSLVGSKMLKDMSVLGNMMNLHDLNIIHGPALSKEFVCETGFVFLNALHTLQANKFIGIPSEIGSVNIYDNCIPRLIAWRDELLAWPAQYPESKLFILGNGRVGKTQIYRRLKGLKFDPVIPSTHGIQLGEYDISLVRASAANGDEKVKLRFWDFGGQDIYLGTHALFLDNQAIYLIVWSPRFENTDEVDENGVVMRNRPLAYWLEYVRSLAGDDARVLVVQTRCDTEDDIVADPPVPANHGFRRLRKTACSANDQVNPEGMERLLVELKMAVRGQLEDHGRIVLPQRWVDIGQVLDDLRDQQQRKTISYHEYESLCDERTVLAPRIVLEYLHRAGRVFWNQDAFDGQVVLQLDWALDGIYAVLHREQAFPLIRINGGLASSELLRQTVWQNRTDRERKLFMSMMQQCQIVFEVAWDQYLVPAALPAVDAVAASMKKIWRSGDAEVAIRLDYGFLHEGVLRAVLCNIGWRAGTDAVYWQYGVCAYDEETQATLRISSQLPDPQGRGPGGPDDRSGGWVLLETKGRRARRLAEQLLKAIQGIRIGAAPTVVWEPMPLS